MLGEAVAAHRERGGVEADLECVLAAGGVGAPYVLAADAGRAVLHGVPEEEGVAGAQPDVEKQLGGEDAGVVVPAYAADAAVLQGADAHALGVGARVAVVDGDIAVDAVAVGAHDVVRLAFRQLAAVADADALVVAEGVQPAVARGAELGEELVQDARGLDEGAVGAAGGAAVAARSSVSVSRRISDSSGSCSISSSARTARSDSGRCGRRAPCCQ